MPEISKQNGKIVLSVLSKNATQFASLFFDEFFDNFSNGNLFIHQIPQSLEALKSLRRHSKKFEKQSDEEIEVNFQIQLVLVNRTRVNCTF